MSYLSLLEKIVTAARGYMGEKQIWFSFKQKKFFCERNDHRWFVLYAIEQSSKKLPLYFLDHFSWIVREYSPDVSRHLMDDEGETGWRKWTYCDKSMDKDELNTCSYYFIRQTDSQERTVFLQRNCYQFYQKRFAHSTSSNRISPFQLKWVQF